MIVFVTVSKRRVLVLNVPRNGNDWHMAEGQPGMGYVAVRADIIGGPVSYAEALNIATDYAAEKGQLISNEAWHAQRAGGKSP